ncbi:MAG: proprotein convertase P-domain-containing protein [Chitinophagaceae bacterium]|nr:proprotein convertase P-domain-containing protein [Chitinophagaceae bacterium]
MILRPLCQGDPKRLTVINAPTVGSCVTNSGAINLPLPDLSSATSNLTVSCVPAGATATSASVKFNITHTWDGDLSLFLKAPNNQVLNLVNQKGGSGDNFTNTVVSSTGTLTFGASAPPFTNTYLADGDGAAPAPPAMTQTTPNFAGLLTDHSMAPGPSVPGTMQGGGIGTLLNWEVTLIIHSCRTHSCRLDLLMDTGNRPELNNH